METCKKEAQELNIQLTHIKNKFQSGGESLMNAFKMADTNKDGKLTMTEFMTALTKQKIYIKQADI